MENKNNAWIWYLLLGAFWGAWLYWKFTAPLSGIE